MGKICSHSSAETKVSIGGSDISQRSLEALKLKHYGIFGEGICNIPDAELRMPDESDGDSGKFDELLQVLLREHIPRDEATTRNLEEAMIIPSKLPKDLRPPHNQTDTESKRIISVGSVGHPLTCAPACKHAKRKAGCRDGEGCPKCHICFWIKDPTLASPALRQPGVEIIKSVGSMNHPHGCGDACKYVRRKSGCIDGAACFQCHLCIWTKDAKMKRNTRKTQGSSEHSSADVTTTATTSAATTTDEVLLLDELPPPTGNSPWDVVRDRVEAEPVAPCGVGLPPPPPSLGSTAHPYSCAAACKFIIKSRGCKDGAACSFCHLCCWSRHGGASHPSSAGKTTHVEQERDLVSVAGILEMQT